ncbi:MAG: TetR/AcrR family transcriptional regulator [Raoultibacter sp.]
MNEKFFALSSDKQRRILNAGFRVFAHHGYRHASTEMIAKEAGISKGLLFHYFGSKKAFYLYLFEYGMNFMVERLRELQDYCETDLFKICIDAQMRKLDIAVTHPDLTQFVLQGYLEEDAEIAPELSENFNQHLNQSTTDILNRIDQSKFKESITPEQAWNIVLWMSEGYTKALTSEELEDLEAASARYLEYIEILRKQFYREEYL